MLFNEDKKVQHPACLSQDSEGPLLLLAIAGTDVHPPLLAGFAVGGSNLIYRKLRQLVHEPLAFSNSSSQLFQGAASDNEG